MNRRNFLRNFGISLGVLTLPKDINSQETKKLTYSSDERKLTYSSDERKLTYSSDERKLTYSFDEIFYRPYESNQNLIYVKNDSILADKIYATGKIDKNFTSEYSTGMYFPVRDIFIEYKNEYYEQDFAGIIFYLKNKDARFWKFIPFNCEKIDGRSPMRFILNKEGYMQAEFLSKTNY